MTEKPFSPIEWGLVTELPRRVIAATASVERDSAGDLAMELAAGLSELTVGAEMRTDVPLIGQILAAVQQDAGDPERDFLTSEYAMDHLLIDTLRRAGQVSTILQQRVTSPEQLAYSSWLLSTAEAVAMAAKSEGGPFGAGGTRVTNAEAIFLKHLTQHLTS